MSANVSAPVTNNMLYWRYANSHVEETTLPVPWAVGMRSLRQGGQQAHACYSHGEQCEQVLSHAGEGEFGIVHKAAFHGTLVAAKILKGSSAIALGDFRSEIEVLRKVHHPNAVQFLGACTKQEPYILVTGSAAAPSPLGIPPNVHQSPYACGFRHREFTVLARWLIRKVSSGLRCMVLTQSFCGC